MPPYYIKNTALGTVDRVNSADPRQAAKDYMRIHQHAPRVARRLRVVDAHGYAVKEYRVLFKGDRANASRRGAA